MSTHDQSLAGGSFDLPIVPKRHMSEEEFVAWCVKNDIGAEWVAGEVIMMSPVSTEHGALFLWLARVLGDFVERNDLGTIFGPEVQVRLAQLPSRREPDLLFISNARNDQVRKNHIETAPDMIAEIVSPESVSRDWREKYLEYEAAGVREYWVIDPMAQHAELYVLSAAGKYVRIAERDGWLISTAVPGFRVKTEWLWPATRPKVADALRELNALTG